MKLSPTDRDKLRVLLFKATLNPDVDISTQAVAMLGALAGIPKKAPEAAPLLDAMNAGKVAK